MMNFKELYWAGRKINSKRFHTVWSHFHSILEITKWHNLDDKLMFSRSLRRSQDRREVGTGETIRGHGSVSSPHQCVLCDFRKYHI